MQLDTLHCRSFRALADLRFAPQPGLNLIRGGNAQGKTSILEAILFAATSKSHRTANEADLVRHGDEAFHLALTAQSHGRALALEANWWRGVKRFKVNGVLQSRVSDILGRLHAVFFSPEDITLVKGGAGERRRFLDMELSQVDPLYLSALQQYRQALRQRNELLRTRTEDAALFEAWETQLAAHGAALVESRRGFVEALSPLAAQAHAAIGGGETLALEYQPDTPDAEALTRALERSRASDLKRGLTSRGPHRDDVEIAVSALPARSHGSQGQQRTTVLAMKLAELEIVRQRTGEYPVLMLDDVCAELDTDRARALFDAVPESVQCLVTTADLHMDPDRFARTVTVFQVAGGNLV